MKTLSIELKDHPYSIAIDAWNLERCARVIQSFLKEKRLFVITNTTVKTLYQKAIDSAFHKYFDLIWIPIGDGERYKTLATCEKILTRLSQKGAVRNSLILALGGGVVGDIAGFVAATYMRGIDYIQMPTTLLAQVDSSVGGKTGVDLISGKNLVGAFYQPKAVLMQTRFLKSLPRRELLCGLAEVIKYGLIWDAGLFSLLNQNRQAVLKLKPDLMEEIIFRCCQIKAQVVKKDEREASLRALLNFGHTLGHAIEAISGFTQIKHGEAVAMGMVFAARVSDGRGYSRTPLTKPVRDLIAGYHLPTAWPAYPKTRYLQAIKKDKKAGGQAIKFILLKKIGKAGIVSLSPSEILKWL